MNITLISALTLTSFSENNILKYKHPIRCISNSTDMCQIGTPLHPRELAICYVKTKSLSKLPFQRSSSAETAVLFIPENIQ